MMNCTEGHRELTVHNDLVKAVQTSAWTVTLGHSVTGGHRLQCGSCHISIFAAIEFAMFQSG